MHSVTAVAVAAAALVAPLSLPADAPVAVAVAVAAAAVTVDNVPPPLRLLPQHTPLYSKTAPAGAGGACYRQSVPGA